MRGRLETGLRRERGLAAAIGPWRSLGAGMLASESGNRLAAERGYREAKVKDPGLSYARNGLGRWRLGRGQVGRASAEARAAAWSDPQHPFPWLLRSWAADRRGHLERAAEAAWEASVRAPGDAALAARLSSLARRRGDKAFAEKTARALSEGDAVREAEIHLRAYELWWWLGRKTEAAAALADARAVGLTEAEIGSDREATAWPKPLRRFLGAFGRGVRGRYRHYRATQEAETVEEFVAWARGLYERTTAVRLGPQGTIHRFRFVGALVDARADSDEPLVRALAQHGLLLVLGQRNGGPPEAILAPIDRRETGGHATVRRARIDREVVWVRSPLLKGYAEWGGGGDLAGLALAGLILIDVDAVASWEGRLRRRRARLAPLRRELLADRALKDRPVRAVDDPAGVADKLNLTGAFRLAEEVRVHEDAHLVDADLHLPVGKHAWRNLRLALSRGLSADKIVAYLERNAQVTAIAEGPTPRAAFADCCSRLGGSGPHARGYTEIVQGVVDAILAAPERYPAIDPQRVVVQQLHRLGDGQIRALARELMGGWGLRANAE